MATNGGYKENHSSPVDSLYLRWEGGDKVPETSAVGRGGGLRGMEANVNENKGSPMKLTGFGTGNTHENGVNGSPPCGLDESC